jgi:NTE family protein
MKAAVMKATGMKMTRKNIFLMGVALLLQGCVSLLPPDNASIKTIDYEKGYRPRRASNKPIGDHNIVLAFSGGGTRAAALSYGVMEELRDAKIDSKGQRVRVLDEVDVISSVSGGSFTSAYYGLYGDDIFKNYEKDFLHQSVQSSLIRNLLSPSYWFHAMFSGINRTDMAIDYYDRTLFHGKTFADIPLDKRPFIEINATDLQAGAHFSFAQGFFDLVCSDLYKYPVARAVTASSGVPIAFPPVVLKNNATECDVKNSYFSSMLNKKTFDNAHEKSLVMQIKSYQDVKKRPYIHLVDGGISDNLGLRAVTDRLELLDSNINEMLAKNPVKDVVVILVNAAVKPEKTIDMSYQTPSISDTAGALTDGMMNLYSTDTRALVKQKMHAMEEEAHAAGNDVHFYFVEVDFDALDSPTVLKYFNSLPTSLELSDEEVDNLVVAGRTLLRKSKPFQDFMARNNGQLVKAPEEKKSCTLLNPVGCMFN